MQHQPYISVLIIDRHPAFLQMITRFLDQQTASNIAIVGAVFRAEDALTLARACKPQIVVLGLNGDTPAALALITPLRELLPQLHVIAIAQLGLPEYRHAALAAGADCFLSTDTIHRDLLPTILGLADLNKLKSYG